MIYLILWTLLIGLTLLSGLAGLFWGLKNGQFEDQNRVRYFPLIDLPEPDDGPCRPRRHTIELYVMGLCVILVVAAIIASFLLSIRFFGEG